jgi:hypothetical protein
MNAIIEAFLMTIELWVFLAVLLIALVVEEGVVTRNRKLLVDNPALK